MVRFAEKADIKQVNNLRKQVNDIHSEGRPDIFRSGFGAEAQQHAYTMLEDENKDIIVVVREGIICGYACVEYITSNENTYVFGRKYYRISEFGVDENHRRQKVATELFEFIKQNSKEKGFETIELNVWAFNEEALKFYEALGFSTYRRTMEYNNK